MRFLCYNQRIYTHAHRHWLTLVILALTVGLGHHAHAQLVTVPDRPPVSVGEVKDFTNATALGDAQDGPIATALNDAMCGGTRPDESLDITPVSLGKIADVQNVPGRHGDPLGQILSGIAKRFDDGGVKNDGFEFPPNTKGHTTACLPNMPDTVQRTLKWGEVIDVKYPQISDPTCKQYGGITEPYMTPSSCQRACNYMNRMDPDPAQAFGYWDCRSQVVWFLGAWICLDGGPGVTSNAIGLTWRYVCSDGWADEPNSRNCLACQGEACRCPGPNCRTAANGNAYQSFDRQYVAESRRQKVNDVPGDQLASQAPPKADCSAEERDRATAQANVDRAQADVTQLLNVLTPKRELHVQKLTRIALLQQMIQDGQKKITTMEADVQTYEELRANHPDDYKPDEDLTTDERVAQLTQIIDDLHAQIDSLRQQITQWEQEKQQLTDEAEQLRAEIGVLTNELGRMEDALSSAIDALDEADRTLRDCREGKAVRVPVACYGFYQEFDAKKQVTDARDRRCTMGFPLNPKDLKQSQKGKGSLFTPVPDLPYTPRKGNYDESTDIWDPNLGGAMSLLSDKPFSEQAGGDLHRVLLELQDVASIHVAPSRTTGEPNVKHGLVRAFDDTAGPSTLPAMDTQDSRTFTRWWQQLQTDATRLLTPPRVRLRLPDTGALVPKIPLLGTGVVVRRDSGNRSIDVEIRADDDMLGTVAAYLKSSLLLQLQEEPVPVVVPMGSPAEFRAVRDRWCQWALQRHYTQAADASGADCRDVAPENVKALMDRLDAYAVQIEQVRLLRAELPKHIGAILSRQQAVVSAVGSWVTDNLQAYNTYLRNRRDRGRLIATWKQVQAEASRFTDQTNMPWCRNDRFTLPIYSLLDPWLEQAAGGSAGGQRRGLSGGTPSCTRRAPGLPVLCPPESDQDIVLDFSTLIVEPGSVTFPVLKPVQIRLTLPVPPVDGDPDPQAIDLPELPPVPTLNDSDIAQLPEVDVRKPLPPVIAQPEQMNLNLAWSAMMRSKLLLEQMNQAYDTFWKSLEPQVGPIAIDCPADPSAPQTNAPPSPQRCELTGNDLLLRCANWDDSPCVHTEVDLIERLTRIMARPAVLLREDLASQGLGRTLLHSCDPTDEACLELLREQQSPKDGWQLVPPTDAQSRQPAIQAIRDRLRQATIDQRGQITRFPAPSGTDRPTPYSATPAQIAPIFTVPDPIVLTPQRSSSNPSPTK